MKSNNVCSVLINTPEFLALGSPTMDHYLVHQIRSAGAATHAIVIGAGDYPHLLGGRDSLSDHHDGMGQLSSPPLSARAVAEWLISSYNNSKKPLNSIALLPFGSQPLSFCKSKNWFHDYAGARQLFECGTGRSGLGRPWRREPG